MKKKHDGIVLLGKAKLNTIEVLLSKSLIDSYMTSKILREYNEMKEEIKNPETLSDIFYKYG